MNTQYKNANNRVSELAQNYNVEFDNGFEGLSNESDIGESKSAKILDFVKRKKILVISLAIVAAIVYGVYDKYFNLSDQERAQKELSAAVGAVGKLMVLPQGDEPVLATVTDAEALIKQQAFFAGAINNDQLLLFPKSMKAVIYSPSRNVIVNAGPIEQQTQNNKEIAASSLDGLGTPRNDNAEISDVQPSVNAQLKIAFYNGTKTVGLANETETRLKAVFPDFETAIKSNAVKNDYKETLVVDLTGGARSQEVQIIAGILGGKVSILPQGEVKPEAEIVIIAVGA